MTAVEIVRPGILLTVQDLGRPGQGRFGVSPAGAMDPLALRMGNRLLGNPNDTPALEITGAGAELVFSGPVVFVLAGADLGAHLDDGRVAPWVATIARPGSRLHFRERVRGARAILAVAGGLDVPRTLGSASTDLDAGLGSGRLTRGQSVPVRGGSARAGTPDLSAILAAYDDPFRLRFIATVEPALAAPSAFCHGWYRISERSNRTGYRLAGPALAVTPAADRLSSPLAPGTIQVPPDGQPILLMADRQTIGGYPCVGHLIAADRAKAAQLWPGDSVQFVAVSLEEGHRAARAQAVTLDAI